MLRRARGVDVARPSSKGGVVMKSTIWALCAALGLAPAMAQPGATVSPQQAPQSQRSERAAISSIVVAEIDSLPKSVRKEVDAQIAHMSDRDLEALRHTLSALPAASSALSAKGKSISNVVAAALDPEGALLLVTTTEV
jgi:hypothetical protein